MTSFTGLPMSRVSFNNAERRVSEACGGQATHDTWVLQRRLRGTKNTGASPRSVSITGDPEALRVPGKLSNQSKRPFSLAKEAA